MKKAERNYTLLMAGVIGWLAVMLITRPRAEFSGAELFYYSGFALFIVGFVLVNISHKVAELRYYSLSAMLIEIIGFLLVYLTCQSTDALILLVIYAGQLPFFLKRQQAIAVLVAINTSAFLIYYFVWEQAFNMSLIAISLHLAFQFFALAVADIAVRESKARLALEQANAELMSTRSLLEQTSRQSERIKLSRDLHDICGHQLTALLLNLEFLSQTVPAEKQAGVNETKAIAKDLLAQIRSVVKQNKQSAQLDLNAAVDSLFSHLPQVTARFEKRLNAPLQSSHHAEVLLRICQEAVSNALRHGSTKEIEITITQDDSSIHMTVSNPFSGGAAKASGSGLANMQERAAQLDGEVSISTSGNCWKVSVTLPYKEQYYD